MAEKGMVIPDAVMHARFVRALPDEDGHIKAMLQAMKNRNRAKIIHMVEEGVAAVVPAARASILRERSGGRSGARRGRGNGRGGTQDRGHGGSSSKGGGRSSGRGSSSANSASRSSHGGGSRPPDRCW